MENTKKIDIVFIGTAAFGVPLLAALAKDERFHIPLVVTREDRPAGRCLKPAPSPIKQAAERLNLPLFQPKDVNAKDSIQTLAGPRHGAALPMLIIVVAYGQILKKSVLEIPSIACVNVHGSLLPKYRGASPIQSALLGGKSETGISVMRVEEGVDSGAVYATFPIPIRDDETSLTLHDTLAQLSAEKTPDALEAIARGTLKSTPQNDKEATHCAKITKKEGKIDWNESAETISLKIRAFAGWPETYTTWNEKILKILEAIPSTQKNAMGTVAAADDTVLVGTNHGSLQLKLVQLEGKRPQSIQEFLNGHPDFIGAALGI
ncbi:methionyl-tRNA formyltransferase [Candidatus Peregrinibacteria bacterium]|nr:methionyl-tRNA formyltransferase [Candidatus Peregrinibacteria bacterium]